MQILTNDIVNDGLVLYLDAGIKGSYPGSGTTWTDLAGSNDGTLTDGPTFNSANGGSIVFDGSNDFVSASASNIVSDAITVDIWLKADQTTHQLINYPFSIGTGTTGVSFAVWAGGTYSDSTVQNYAVGFAKNGQFKSSVANTFTSSDNSLWRNIVVTNDGTSSAIYKNNSSLSLFSNEATAESINSSNLITIGKRNDNVWYWDGDIAVVKVYNRALSAAEVTQNFEATRNRFGI